MGGVAGDVDDLVELGSGAGVFHNLAGECVGDGVEEPPSRALGEVGKARLLPFLVHVRYARDVDDASPVERHDDMVGLLVAQIGLLVAGDGLVLRFPLVGDGLDQLADEARQPELELRGVLGLDHVIRHEGRVVADEDPRAEGDAHGQSPVVGIAKPYHVGIARVGAMQGEDAEVAVAVRGHAMVLLNHLMSIVGQRVSNEIDKPVMRDGDVRLGRLRHVQFAQAIIFDGFGASM